MEDGAEGEAVPPGGGHVDQPHTRVAGCHSAGPDLQGLTATHNHPAEGRAVHSLLHTEPTSALSEWLGDTERCERRAGGVGGGVWAPEQISIPSSPPFRHLQALQPKAVLSGVGGRWGEGVVTTSLSGRTAARTPAAPPVAVMVKHLTAFTEVIMTML
jgi:hypothetical protein